MYLYTHFCGCGCGIGGQESRKKNNKIATTKDTEPVSSEPFPAILFLAPFRHSAFAFHMLWSYFPGGHFRQPLGHRGGHVYQVHAQRHQLLHRQPCLRRRHNCALLHPLSGSPVFDTWCVVCIRVSVTLLKRSYSHFKAMDCGFIGATNSVNNNKWKWWPPWLP